MRPDWCAVCVARKQRKDNRFNGTQGLQRAVTTVKGTRVCGTHAAELVEQQSDETEGAAS